MDITNDEITLITKEEHTWPPEYYQVYLLNEDKTGIPISRLENEIKLTEEKTISIKDIIGKCWVPTPEKRRPGVWMFKNIDVLLPQKNLWAYRKHYSDYYPKRKCLVIWDEDYHIWSIGKSEYDNYDLQQMFDYFQIVEEPDDPVV